MTLRHLASTRPVAVVALGLLTAGCTLGSGQIATQSRDVGRFDTVVLQTSGDVSISITGTPSVEIEADDNVLPLLTTAVTGGRLELGSERSFTTTRAIKYTVTAAELTGVEVSGSGDVVVSGLDAGPFTAEISGSGNVEPVGSCTDLTVRISGSGGFKGESLTCATGTVSVSGSGSAAVDVSDELGVDISGSGSVSYAGDPSLSQEISGSGTLTRR